LHLAVLEPPQRLAQEIEAVFTTCTLAEKPEQGNTTFQG
jgi:hypothetical protein